MKLSNSDFKPNFTQRVVRRALLFLCIFSSIHNAFAKNEHDILLVTDGAVIAEFSEQKAKGTVSLALAMNATDEKRTKVYVKHLNIALFDVAQYQLSGISSEKNEAGSVGFRVADKQYLELDLSKNRLVGELKGWIDYSQQAEINPPEMPKEGGEFIPPPLQPASIYLEMQMSESMQLEEEQEEMSTVDTELLIRLLGLEDEKYNYRGFKVTITTSSIPTTWGYTDFLELGKSLCIQPVRVADQNRIPPWLDGHNGRFHLESGTGLKFGMPAAKKQWGQVDVVFNVRDWITIENKDYVIADPYEHYELMAEVNQSDCIEVFFTHKFDPEDMYGGGFTFVGGTSSAKIVSSDDNVNGIDFHHLAHELGHVLSLMHPGPDSIAQFPSQKEASTGTLMCSSGYRKDNPAKNSDENGNNLSNPLLRFTLKRIDEKPDCQNSQDCGDCPSF